MAVGILTTAAVWTLNLGTGLGLSSQHHQRPVRNCPSVDSAWPFASEVNVNKRRLTYCQCHLNQEGKSPPDGDLRVHSSLDACKRTFAAVAFSCISDAISLLLDGHPNAVVKFPCWIAQAVKDDASLRTISNPVDAGSTQATSVRLTRHPPRGLTTIRSSPSMPTQGRRMNSHDAEAPTVINPTTHSIVHASRVTASMNAIIRKSHKFPPTMASRLVPHVGAPLCRNRALSSGFPDTQPLVFLSPLRTPIPINLCPPEANCSPATPEPCDCYSRRP